MGLSVPGLFEAQVARCRRRLRWCRMVCAVSYGELEGRANRLARFLRDQGVGAESVVGLCLPRGVESVVGFWRCGRRVRVMFRWMWFCRRSGSRSCWRTFAGGAGADVGGDSGGSSGGSACGWWRWMIRWWRCSWRGCLRGRWGSRCCRVLLAYVIYTSGSTGRPKGVAITHGALANYVSVMPDRSGFAGSGGRYGLLQGAATDLGNTMVFAAPGPWRGAACPARGVGDRPGSGRGLAAG